MSEPGVPARHRRRRLGQNFLADPNLLDAIVRGAELEPDDVVLEVGGGEGALTERIAPMVRAMHVVEIDGRLREVLEGVAADHDSVQLHMGDALRLDLTGLEPAPRAMVANLPYAIATPVLLETIFKLPSIRSWTVMVQREIGDRLRAAPGTSAYGATSVLAQLACRIEMLRVVDRAVFVPRPRVDSAVIRLTRRGPAPDQRTREIVKAAFAHRRKALARSLELALTGEDQIRARAREALGQIGLGERARAQELDPDQHRRLAAAILGANG